MTEDSGIFLKPLSELQPSQLYISMEKLKNVQSSLDFSEATNIPPIPIKHLEHDLVMTDGHTRAFAAHLAGFDKVAVCWDEDVLDWDAYRICVQWCKEEGVHTPSDYHDRVVSADQYRLLWLDRCQRMQDELAEKRKGAQAK